MNLKISLTYLEFVPREYKKERRFTLTVTRREFMVSAAAGASEAIASRGSTFGRDADRTVATPRRSAAGDFILPPGVQILVDASEAGPVHLAIQDLQRDLEKVLGSKSEIVTTSSAIAGRPAIVVTCQGATTSSYRDRSLKNAESHELRAEGNTSAPRMILQGADTRGTIYAIYEFSRQFLNVPPLWYWSSWQAPAMDHVAFSGSLKMRFAPPAEKYRVWFPNDTDMLTDWLEQSSGNLNAFFETLLRLKFNALNVNNISEYHGKANKGLQWARESKSRGIIVTYTHYTPFGADIGDWVDYWTSVAGKSPPALEFSAAGELTPTLISDLQQFWKHYIDLAQREGFEVIQTIVFRGHGDHPYWFVFANAPTGDAARAAIINQLLQIQVALLKSTWDTHLSPFPPMRAIFYTEVADFLAQGLLKPPEEPDLIWNFASQRRVHVPDADIMRYDYKDHPNTPVGYYLNLQFNSTGSHLAAGEGPWKIERNLRIVSSQAGPGNLVLVELNIGNVREFAMEIELGGDLAWNLQSYLADRTTVSETLRSFCARYFGSGHAAQAASLYAAYYMAYWEQRRPDFPGGFLRQFIFDDLRYSQASQSLLTHLASGNYSANPFRSDDPNYFGIVPGDCGATSQVEAVLNGTAAAAKAMKPIVASCKALLTQLPQHYRSFFKDDLCLQAEFMLQINLMLQSLAFAMLSLGKGNRPEIADNLRAAAAALNAAEDSLNERTRAPFFATWYTNERIFGVRRLARTLDGILTQYGSAE